MKLTKTRAMFVAAFAVVACDNEDPEPAVDIVPSITVRNQTADPANRVVVAKVVSPAAGFVVIHEDDQGSPGAVLGNTAVEKGESANVSVTLSRDAVDKETLYAMLHADTGQVGVYEFDGANGLDLPVKDDKDAVVTPSFTVTVSGQLTPSVTVADQTADPANEVVVAAVVSAGRGFIVIHEAAAGSPGPVIGNASVSNGTSSDVKVTLDRDAVDGETLYAMLHTDDGAVGTYEFDGMNGLDAPVMDGMGNVITPSFVVSTNIVIPAVEVDNQLMLGATDRVVVRLVTSDGGGFIVIHEDDGMGGFGAVLGNTAVSHGNNADVAVTLSRDVRHDETLYAMLHTDTGVIGTYEFNGMNGLDGPVMNAGGMVIAPSFSAGFEPSVTANDQAVDPTNEVTVAMAISRGEGFVVIHEDNGMGSFGAVLGNASLTNGTNRNITIALNRSVIHSETLYAMLHTDTGVLGMYEFDGMNGLDGPVMDAGGTVIAPPIVVSFEPLVDVVDQWLDPTNEVTIAKVVSRGVGFVVIHEDNGMGTFGAVIGNTALANGTNRDVVVTLDRMAVNGETLYAMLHTDTGVIGTYEFDGMNGFDGPVMDAGGNVITPSLVVSYSEVLVADQSVDPTTEVVIDSVTTNGPSFVVIHESDGMGSFGDVIGNAAVSTGTSSVVTVTLDRSVVQGETLYAMLHTDDGVIGTYEFDGMNGLDAPITLDGQVVTPSFVATFTPRVTVADQTLGMVLDEVLIAEAVSPGPGFLVVHEDNGMGGIGDVIGNAALVNGTNTDVTVTLSRDTVSGETLYGMLHFDTGVVGTYEFDGMSGLDGPVLENFMVIAPAFVVTH